MLNKIKKYLENNLVVAWVAPIITGLILAFLLYPLERKTEDPKLPTGYNLFKEFMRAPGTYQDEITILKLSSKSTEYGIAPKYVCNALGLEYGNAIFINVSVSDNESKINYDEIISLYADGKNSEYFERLANGEILSAKVQLKQFNSAECKNNDGLCRRLLFINEE